MVKNTFNIDDSQYGPCNHSDTPGGMQQPFTLVSVVLACILLFPMPLNSRGEILYAASTCYRRMW
jgi:hypothetical protein